MYSHVTTFKYWLKNEYHVLFALYSKHLAQGRCSMLKLKFYKEFRCISQDRLLKNLNDLPDCKFISDPTLVFQRQRLTVLESPEKKNQ